MTKVKNRSLRVGTFKHYGVYLSYHLGFCQVLSHNKCSAFYYGPPSPRTLSLFYLFSPRDLNSATTSLQVFLSLSKNFYSPRPGKYQNDVFRRLDGAPSRVHCPVVPTTRSDAALAKSFSLRSPPPDGGPHRSHDDSLLVRGYRGAVLNHTPASHYTGAFALGWSPRLRIPKYLYPRYRFLELCYLFIGTISYRVPDSSGPLSVPASDPQHGSGINQAS